MNRLIEDLGLTELESKYLDEMQKMQKRMGDLMEDVETSGTKGNISTPLADVMETDDAVVIPWICQVLKSKMSILPS